MGKNALEASVWVADEVEGFIKDGKIDLFESSFADLVIAWSSGIKRLETGNTLLPSRTYYQISYDMVLLLTTLAEIEPHFYDACTDICATNALAGVAMPNGMEFFAAGVLSGKKQSPKGNGAPRKKNFAEKYLLYSLVTNIKEKFGINYTQDDGADRGESACDILAKALTVCGAKTSYTTLKNLMVHKNHERDRREIVAARQIFSRARSNSDVDVRMNLLNFFDEDFIKKRRQLDEMEMHD